MKVFFDIITNHTADVIDYAGAARHLRLQEGRPPTRTPTGTSSTTATTSTQPLPGDGPGDVVPYTPFFPTAADATAKIPAWLNDPLMYHNRGDSTFAGESSTYGDFSGLDDLFTEQPEVVKGMGDIYKKWVDFGIDGFRIDTVKHVNMEFWQEFVPGILGRGQARRQRRLLHLRRGLRRQPGGHVRRTRPRAAAGHPRLRVPAAGVDFAKGGAATELRRLLRQATTVHRRRQQRLPAADLPRQPRHGPRRIFLKADGGERGRAAAARPARRLADVLTRGKPVIYYGDEQGFIGDGGDQDAREDMFASKVDAYNDDDLIGTDPTAAATGSTPPHPMYRHIARPGRAARRAPGARRRRADPPLRQGRRRRLRVQPHRRGEDRRRVRRRP